MAICSPTKMDECMKSIGFMRSIFNKKNGTPRQSSICPESKGIIEINKSLFNNPMHSLEGIQDFTHIWSQTID
jgi:tRNA (Thr-GGU) A37 N-methylase